MHRTDADVFLPLLLPLSPCYCYCHCYILSTRWGLLLLLFLLLFPFYLRQHETISQNMYAKNKRTHARTHEIGHSILCHIDFLVSINWSCHSTFNDFKTLDWVFMRSSIWPFFHFHWISNNLLSQLNNMHSEFLTTNHNVSWNIFITVDSLILLTGRLLDRSVFQKSKYIESFNYLTFEPFSFVRLQYIFC